MKQTRPVAEIEERAQEIVALVRSGQTEEAKRRLKAMGSEASDVAEIILARSLQRRVTGRFMSGLVYLGIGVVLNVGVVTGHKTLGSLLGWGFPFIAGWTFLLILSIPLWEWRKEIVGEYVPIKMLVEEFAECERPSAVGVLSQIIASFSRNIDQLHFDLAYKKLIRLLPDLRADDFTAFSQQQRDALFALLQRYSEFMLYDEPREEGARQGHVRTAYDLRMSRALLQAFHHGGDARTLEYVRRLSKVPEGVTEAARVVRKEARTCLPLLEAHVAAARTGEQLLRASNEPTATADILLRPAQATAEAEPDLLLRATVAEEEAEA